MPLKASLSVAIVLALCVASIAAPRTWKSANGQHSIEAELVKIDGDSASLKKSDGQVISVPINQLSTEDQAFLKKQAKPDPNEEKVAAAKKKLEEKGLKALSRGLVLEDETKFGQEMRGVSNLKRALLTKDKEFGHIKNQEQTLRAKIAQLTQANVVLNAQLAQVGPNDVATNNRLVGLINANLGQIRLLDQQLVQLEQLTKAARAEASKAREDFIEHILGLRKLADSIHNRYAELATDPSVKEELGKLNEASEKSYELGASSGFTRSLANLKSIEDTILSEDIKLEVDAGNALLASVVINGEHNVEMQVDSGASIISLPQDMATKCGIVVAANDPEIILELADGSQIRAHRKTIPSVRVGKFTVQNVECAVLGSDAVNAVPLLGMSFLGQFKFEIDSQQGVLKMVKIEAEDASGRSR